MKNVLFFLIILALTAWAVAGARRGEDRPGTGRVDRNEIATVAAPQFPRNDRREAYPLPVVNTPVAYPYPGPVTPGVGNTPEPTSEPAATSVPCEMWEDAVIDGKLCFVCFRGIDTPEFSMEVLWCYEATPTAAPVP